MQRPPYSIDALTQIRVIPKYSNYRRSRVKLKESTFIYDFENRSRTVTVRQTRQTTVPAS
jgi:hypothetical protein